ncbi:FAD binding domain-containing protein [Bordetella bronchiseptica]|uniref:FAD binding domain-containing protein n=1 Tax=Bordetella bronchiseptica TaxID=518 RepID=UPI0009B8FCB2|nr:FAD binding domain-containing protein [Bordetella bronchiseptica]QET73371.1 FAD-dependent oxidoreductase [Bordetella bronchiseptica]
MRKAAVIGGSLGGLFAANLLLRAGWDVHVHERVHDELDGRGAGIVTHPELLDVLRRIGVAPTESIGIEVARRVTLDLDGSVLASRPLPQLLTAWGRLFSILRARFPAERYHRGQALESLEQDERRALLRFADGTRAEVDLVVAADGLRSTLRQALLPQARPAYAGYVAWRGLVDEASLSERTRRELCPYFAFGLPAHEQMIAYPVAGTGSGAQEAARRFNFVWYRPADEHTTFRDMVTDAQGQAWMDGIPPPLIRPEIVAQARQAAAQVLAPQFGEVVAKTANLFFQPIFDLESPRLALGRVALLGDAAFVARPHCGMGVTKAAGDARALADALAGTPDIGAALQAYERERLPFGEFIVGHARDLGRYMQAQLRDDAEREMAERYRTPEAIMRETAVAPAWHQGTAAGA